MVRPGWLTARPIAHRGLHDPRAGIPENTLAAAEAAIAGGYAIEVDLRAAADGIAVVFHDRTLSRLTAASGPVAAHSAAELTSFHVAGTTQRIPTLMDLLDLTAGRVPLILEVKNEDGDPAPLAAAIIRDLSTYRGDAAVMSFDPRTLDALTSLPPVRPRGFISYAYDDDEARSNLRSTERWARRNLLPIVLTWPDFIAYDADALPRAAATMLRHLGYPVLTWTVRSRDEQRRVKSFADQIIFEGFTPESASDVE